MPHSNRRETSGFLRRSQRQQTAIRPSTNQDDFKSWSIGRKDFYIRSIDIVESGIVTHGIRRVEAMLRSSRLHPASIDIEFAVPDLIRPKFYKRPGE